MNVAFTIARRYLVAKKSHNLINIISLVSVSGVAIGTMGLVIVLSVFNGFGNLVVGLYNSFDPDIKITPVKGRVFEPDAFKEKQLAALPYVQAVIPVLEENALLRYRERQYIATVKGVPDSFLEYSGVKGKMIDGKAKLHDGSEEFMIAGGQIAYSLGIQLDDPFNGISVYLPRKDVSVSTALLDPTAAFSVKALHASGVFSIQQDFDSKYVLVPINFLRDLTGTTSGITALEVMLKKDADADKSRNEIAAITGNDFEVHDRLQQHDFLFKILKSEKFAVYLILGFILLIAAFNLLGTFTMLIIDKKEDLNILSGMGAGTKLLERIFLTEGLLISVGGAAAGMLLGAVLCFIQQHFGVIRLENAEGFVTESYPVAMMASDFIIVFLIVFTMGFISSSYTSKQIVKRQLQEQ